MIARERRGLVAGVCVGGLVLTLFDWNVLSISGIGRGAAFWLSVVVPGLAVLWLAAASWPREPRRFPVLVLAVDAFSIAVTVACAVDGATTWVFAESAALLSLLFAVVRWSPLHAAVWLGGLTGAAASVLPLRFVHGAGIGGATTMCLIWALGAVAAAVLGAYLRHQETTRERGLVEVRRSQRLELARDLHDFVAHHVSGIVVQAQASQVVAERDPAQAVEALRRIEEAGQQALASMRRTVGMLREDGPDTAPATPTPGIADLTELAERFRSAAGTPVRLDIGEGVDDTLPPEVTTSAYRVVLESLTNVRRHAPGAAEVSVAVLRTSGPEEPALRVTVHDETSPPQRVDGQARRGGFGLVGLRERVSAIGGTLHAGPDEHSGWTVCAVLPLPAGPART
ncbi:MAG TPA: histidine kinase [Streptosporangiales bacterium]